MATAAVASAAFRGEVLFVQYSSGDNGNYFGNIYALYTPYAIGASISKGNGGANDDATSGGRVWGNSSIVANDTIAETTLYITPQTIRGDNIGGGLDSLFPSSDNSTGNGDSSAGGSIAPGRVSLVSSTSNVAQTLQHTLLVAYNPSSSSKAAPIVIHLRPRSPSTGDGNTGLEWSYEPQTTAQDPSMLLPSSASQLWLTSALSANMDTKAPVRSTEGSGVIQLFRDVEGSSSGSTASYQLQKLDVSLQNTPGQIMGRIEWKHVLSALDGAVAPKVLRFMSDDDGVGYYYNGVVAGRCAAGASGSPSGTCLVFFNEKETALIRPRAWKN
ncbi:hypothetical protein EDD11_008549 [Mortierella claussenii]|nr:hypothetical protein EDD11_008549 [Mortierella claussenii]